ncbi:phosphotransferase [Nocardioides sp. dk4132]|uniref:phosphotransferase family protein n=1 Tax=unclassified Nocardioides TaxID=2615069 RepID=UPI001296EEC8|nr:MULTISPECIES: aminoglycoside phosphotransferase family protein [unclassified Nocardioides]MQW75467.1 phosphotransferase [Nocardioides sp. dk4132]QGA08386.1 phosphotransferase [Nocardioides sp. dk884]
MDPFAAVGASLHPLEGGWSGETFLAQAGGERSVVRLFAHPRHPVEAAQIQASLLRLVRGLVPAPEVLEVRRADPAAGLPALLVTQWLPGTRLDLILPTLDDTGQHRVGEAVGRLVGTLGGMPFLHHGLFTDGDLHLAPFTRPEEQSLGEVGERARALLDTEGRACLVHSDLSPQNLLVDPETLAVTGLVDWELAHAGHPFTDLGSVLRFERQPAYVAGVLQGYAALRGTDPDRALELARCADLSALAELAARAGENPVADRAAQRLEAILAAGDVHAVEDPV